MIVDRWWLTTDITHHIHTATTRVVTLSAQVQIDTRRCWVVGLHTWLLLYLEKYMNEVSVVSACPKRSQCVRRKLVELGQTERSSQHVNSQLLAS